MEITCSSCGKTINVPDEKIPRDKPFSFSCPNCGSRISVEPAAKRPQPETQSLPETFVPDSDRQGAMLCHAKPEKYKTLLEEMGYQVHTPEYHIEAINNLRFNEYRLIVVTDEYEALTHDGESVLHILQNMLMATRRKIFVVYVAPGLQSFDYLEAFSLSVNAIISVEDMGKKDSVKERLKRAIIENDLFFRVFKEVQSAQGKA
ncbi:MAG: hypothetical protein IEMM0002_0556 [bacterium]|nr:MAG: hypothetical protein IEMM0002_0556 [bacterium]